MSPRIGSLCSGYGGLDMAVETVYGGTTAWVSDIDKGACKILAHRYPDVPNIGDMTAVNWGQVEPVDILTGGTPCQDLSHAGKRAGMTEGTRSNLWVAMREAIAVLRPAVVVWENVRGAYSAAADSEMEPCPGCVGSRPGQPVLRALGRVLGDLSELGYVGGWHGLRAADVGAPHGRFRVFVVAHLADAQRGGQHGRTPDAVGRTVGGTAAAGSGEVARLLPTPTSSDTNGAGAHGDGGLDLRTAVSLLPTPRATDGTKGGPNQRGSSGDLMLPSAVTLLPTPSSMNAANDPGSTESWLARREVQLAKGINGNGISTPLGIAIRLDFGQYADAIARWEHLTRSAPAPTQPSKKGTPQLSPRFSEWLMGLPEGWVTDVPGITRNEALKALGNGVVSQQAEAALRFLHNVQERAA